MYVCPSAPATATAHRQEGTNSIYKHQTFTLPFTLILLHKIMQHHRHNLCPLPDIRRAPSAPPRFPPRPSPPPPPAPDFIIAGLFALRLTKRLIEGLEYYPGRNADIIWLINFLAPFSNDDALAKISGRRKDEYTHMYPSIISRMKKQPRFPIRFMQVNPDRSLLQPQGSGEVERPREMTDGE